MGRLIILTFLLSSFIYAQNMNARAIIVSLDRTMISSQIAGKVLNISKENGEPFKKNELLLEVDCRLYEAQRDKVQIEKDIAQLELQNYEKLDKLRSTSKLEIEQSRAKYEKQKTELDIAQLNVDRCKIYAPFDGRVVTRKASVHQIVKPQEELFDIVSTKHLEVVAVIPSHWISKLKRWQKVSVHIDELDRTAYAFIKEIGAIVDTSSQTINVRLRFKSIQKNILAGMSATVNFN